jgi:hypothetical protein
VGDGRETDTKSMTYVLETEGLILVTTNDQNDNPQTTTTGKALLFSHRPPPLPSHAHLLTCKALKYGRGSRV